MVVTDHMGKAKELFDTYKERLGKKGEYEMKFDLSRIIKKVEGLDELTKPFTHDEIDVVVKEMSPDRAPGPDAGLLAVAIEISLGMSSFVERI